MAGSGKTAFANYLQAKYGFVKLSFAAPVKSIAQAALMIPIDKRKPEHRRLLQQLGTDVFRAAKANVWIYHMALELAKYGDADNIVIDDVRFKNEAEFLQGEGFKLIKITGGDRRVKIGDDLRAHTSEKEVGEIECDDMIVNSGSFTDAVVQLEALIESYAKTPFERDFIRVLRRGR